MTDRSCPHPPVGTVRVLPDLTGLDKEFDYVVPASLVAARRVGSIVRVSLHGRRVRGWVTAVDAPLEVERQRLHAIARYSSLGPAAELLELARWASIRWAAGRLRPFLVAASPPRNVVTLPSRTTRGPIDTPTGAVGRRAAAVLDTGGGVLLLPPSSSPIEAILAAASIGPTLVVMPTAVRAEAMAVALTRRGASTALVPAQWAQAAAGADVVIGARAAAWAPCPDLRVVVIVDEHDETLQEERSPTWHARDVLTERARRSGATVLATSPCPSVSGVAEVGGVLARLPVDAERAGWPIVDVVDRRDEEPWRTSMLSSPLIRELRRAGSRVVCVHNATGRARILACRTCRSLVRCVRCEAAVGLDDDGVTLTCRRCGARRPAVCQSCGASGFANLRPGVTRLREELEAAARRPVVAVTGSDRSAPEPADVYVGTEAVLHRVDHADVVAFLDFDRELLAPRYRANEQAIALIARAARLLGPRSRGGRLLVQTFTPGHEVIQAALLADPGRLLGQERSRREQFGLPPARALAQVSGPGSDAVVDQVGDVEGVEVGGSTENHLVTATTWEVLGTALITAVRPKHSRVRIAVDPPRI